MHSSKVTGWAVLAMVLLFAPALFGQEGGEEIIEMHGVDKIDTLLGFVDEMTGKNIVYDAAIKGNRVKIYGGKAEVPRKDLLRFVETILEMNGYIMTEAPGNVLRVIPGKGTGEPIALRVGREGELPNTATTVTQVVTLEHANPAKVSALVKTMVTTGKGGVAVYDDLRTLFITDAAYKVKKILDVIDQIDKPSPKAELETLKVTHASARELAKMLDTLMQRKAAREKVGRKTVERAYIVADERSSSIIVMGLREEIEDVKRVLERLDRPLAEKEGVFHAYQLKNAAATELAKVLSELYQKKAIAARTGGKPSVARQGSPSIVPEPNTNSLLIIAPPDIYQEMEQLIQKLDVRRPQVLIEVMLVEVSFDETTDWGIELATGDQPESGEYTGFAGTGFDLSTIALDDDLNLVRVPALGTGLFAGMFRGTTRIPVILRAWETAGDVEVLAVPRVLTNDNVEATIGIGDEVPYQITTVRDTGTDITWAFVQANMELKITPHISEADHLRLDLNFKVERFGVQLSGSSPPSKSVRNADTKITIPNENTVIIGGLTRTNIRDTETRVPILHRIPLIGRAFKKTKKVREKTHLFIFITPHILREEAFGDLTDISDKVEIKMKNIKKKDWRREAGTWGAKGSGTRAEGAPKITPLDIETTIKEEKNAGNAENTVEAGGEGDRR